MRLVFGIKCRMTDWSKGIHNRNEGQGYVMEYFEWKSKEIGFYPNDGGNSWCMISLGTKRRGVGTEGTGATLSLHPHPSPSSHRVLL